MIEEWILDSSWIILLSFQYFIKWLRLIFLKSQSVFVRNDKAASYKLVMIQI